MADILNELQADLDALRDLIIEFRISDDNSPEESEAFTALASLVKNQDEVQSTLLPLLKDRGTSLRYACENALERIEGARSVEEMIECCTNRATWRASVNVYCELIDMRIHQEERELFPALFDALTKEERSKLGKRYQELRMIARKESSGINWYQVWNTVLYHAV
jgi:hemerythrin-like domain-containing protein